MPFPPHFRPVRLSRRVEPFDSPDFTFEIKHVGFRALAFVDRGECRLVSRNRQRVSGFRDLAESIAVHLRVEDAVPDCEIVCVDEPGRTVFDDLMFRRGGSTRVITRNVTTILAV